MKGFLAESLEKEPIVNSSCFNSDLNERDDFDGSINWNIEFPETEEIDDNEGKLLTSLVRNTYVRHLRICLLSNYENWWKCFGGGVEMSDTVIARCASEMELKALRRCMMANVYQRTIMEVVKNIKKSTELNKLHEDLFLALNSGQKNFDKAVQTDASVDHQFSFLENDTDPNKTFMLPSSSNEIPFLNSSSTPVSDPCVPEFMECASDPKISTKSNLDLNHLSEVIVKTEPCERSTTKRKSIQSDSCIKKRKSCSSSSEPQKNLDDRLKKFEEIFGETFENSSDTSVKPKDKCKYNKEEYHSRYTKFFLLVNWKSEATAQLCELSRYLLSVSINRRNAVRKRFEELFGPSNVGDEESIIMSPDLFGHCRKRTASLVVAELTPRYEKNEIGSRILFKTLAKEITSILLADSFAPDIEVVKSAVDEVFHNEMKYTSLDQVPLLFQKF